MRTKELNGFGGRKSVLNFSKRQIQDINYYRYIRGNFCYAIQITFFRCFLGFQTDFDQILPKKPKKKEESMFPT